MHKRFLDLRLQGQGGGFGGTTIIIVPPEQKGTTDADWVDQHFTLVQKGICSTRQERLRDHQTAETAAAGGLRGGDGGEGEHQPKQPVQTHECHLCVQQFSSTPTQYTASPTVLAPLITHLQKDHKLGRPTPSDTEKQFSWLEDSKAMPEEDRAFWRKLGPPEVAFVHGSNLEKGEGLLLSLFTAIGDAAQDRDVALVVAFGRLMSDESDFWPCLMNINGKEDRRVTVPCNVSTLRICMEDPVQGLNSLRALVQRRAPPEVNPEAVRAALNQWAAENMACLELAACSGPQGKQVATLIADGCVIAANFFSVAAVCACGANDFYLANLAVKLIAVHHNNKARRPLVLNCLWYLSGVYPDGKPLTLMTGLARTLFFDCLIDVLCSNKTDRVMIYRALRAVHSQQGEHTYENMRTGEHHENRDVVKCLTQVANHCQQWGTVVVADPRFSAQQWGPGNGAVEEMLVSLSQCLFFSGTVEPQVMHNYVEECVKLYDACHFTCVLHWCPMGDYLQDFLLVAQAILPILLVPLAKAYTKARRQPCSAELLNRWRVSLEAIVSELQRRSSSPPHVELCEEALAIMFDQR